MGRKIIWSAGAIAQRKEIFAYWNQRNKSTDYSKKLRTEFRASLDEIAGMPGIGSFTEVQGVLKKSFGIILFSIITTTQIFMWMQSGIHVEILI